MSSGRYAGLAPDSATNAGGVDRPSLSLVDGGTEDEETADDETDDETADDETDDETADDETDGDETGDETDGD